MRLPADLGFESHPHDRRRMVRRDDAETAIAAAARVQGRLSELQRRVHAEIERLGGATGEEVEQLPQFAALAPSTVRRRITDLRDLGLVVAAGERPNSRGLPMTVWRTAQPNTTRAGSTRAESPARELTNACGPRGAPGSVLAAEAAERAPPEPIQVGDWVRIRATGARGMVVAFEDSFAPAFARRLRVDVSTSLVTGRLSTHDPDELERITR